MPRWAFRTALPRVRRASVRCSECTLTAEDSLRMDMNKNNTKKAPSMAKSVHTPDTTARCVTLLRDCESLDALIVSFQVSKPHVEGVDKLRRAVLREREVALRLQTAQDAAREKSVTGLENNLRGFQLELDCASFFPEVTAVRKRFATRPPSAHAKLTDDEVCEVDVVARGGAYWIECKAEKGRVASGLVQQALALQRYARAPCNARPFGVAPKVCVFLTGALGEHDARVLGDAGIVTLLRSARDGGGAALDPESALPPEPAPVTTANLDITALFALVSEVAAATASDDFETFTEHKAIKEWSLKKPQHAACLSAELADPTRLDQALARYKRLVAHPSVLIRFAKILRTSGGPRERERWETLWRARVEVLEVPLELDSRAAARKTQVRALERIANHQLDAFELGETCVAKTFTANGRAVQSAAEQGVVLDAHVHRAIWLVGL